MPLSGRGTLRAPLPRACRIGAVCLFALFLQPPIAPAQGCSQCRESIGQTPAATQRAYRRAITLMVLAGSSVFTAAFISLKRFGR